MIFVSGVRTRKLLINVCVTLILVAATINNVASGCIEKYFGETDQYNIVCVCNATYCDDINFRWPQQNEILVVETDRTGKRFFKRAIDIKTDYHRSRSADQFADNHKFTVKLDTTKRMQKVLGFGGAFTDAATMHLNKMDPIMQQAILEQYFGERGLQYNMGRVTISGSDFSERSYSYDDLLAQDQTDFDLLQFKLQTEDTSCKIPAILKAGEIVRKRQASSGTSGDLLLFASSWSAPSWMKDNLSLVQGHLKGNSSGVYYDAFARYLIKFLQEYEKSGVKFWGITTQNEPETAKLPHYNFNSMIFEKNQLNEFVRDNLGPMLAKYNYTKENGFNLIVFDDNLPDAIEYIGQMVDDSKTMDYVSGVGIHWYGRLVVPYSVIEKMQTIIPSPDIFILSTEACHEKGPKPGDWWRGEEYARDIIETFRHGTVGWVDWNLVLDMIGGPNWVKNFVDAPILYDHSQGEYYKNPMYYTLAQFTRFLEPGATIIRSEIISSPDNIRRKQFNLNYTNRSRLGMQTIVDNRIAADDNDDVVEEQQEIYLIAAERPNKLHLSVIILNTGSNEALVRIQLDEKLILQDLLIGARSVTTIVLPSSQLIEFEKPTEENVGIQNVGYVVKVWNGRV